MSKDKITIYETMSKIMNFYFLMTFTAVLCPVNPCFIPKGHFAYHFVLVLVSNGWFIDSKLQFNKNSQNPQTFSPSEPLVFSFTTSNSL